MMERTIVFLSVFILQVGCAVLPVSGNIERSEFPVARAVVPLGGSEAIAVIARSDEAQAAVVGCIRDRIAAEARRARIISANELRDQFFPWFEPRLVPTNEEQLTSLLGRPLVSAKIDELNLRFLIAVNDPQTTTEDRTAALPPAAAVVSVSEAVLISAAVMDLKSGAFIGTAEVAVTGETGGIFLLPYTVLVAAQTEATACRELGKRIGERLTQSVGNQRN